MLTAGRVKEPARETFSPASPLPPLPGHRPAGAIRTVLLPQPLPEKLVGRAVSQSAQATESVAVVRTDEYASPLKIKNSYFSIRLIYFLSASSTILDTVVWKIARNLVAYLSGIYTRGKIPR